MIAERRFAPTLDINAEPLRWTAVCKRRPKSTFSTRKYLLFLSSSCRGNLSNYTLGRVSFFWIGTLKFHNHECKKNKPTSQPINFENNSTILISTITEWEHWLELISLIDLIKQSGSILILLHVQVFWTITPQHLEYKKCHTWTLYLGSPISKNAITKRS